MRIRGESILCVAMIFEAGCQVVVGLNERRSAGAIEADLAGGSDSGSGGASAQNSQGGSQTSVLGGASGMVGGGGAFGVAGTGGSSTGGVPSAGAAGNESGGTDGGTSSLLKACPGGPYEVAKLLPGTALLDGVGASGRLIGGATLSVAGNDFSFYGIRDSGGSLGFFKADRKGNQFSMAAKWEPAGHPTAMTADRLVVGGSAQELWLLNASNGSVISLGGSIFSQLGSTMVTGYPTAIERSVEGVWIAGKAELVRYTSKLERVFAYPGSAVVAPSGLATHLLPNGNARVMMSDSTALKQVASFEFDPTGKLVRTNKPLIKPIVALATDCAGTTYASDGLETWQISLNDEVSTPVQLIPCKAGCDCPQITGLGFDDRNKLLATTSYTSCNTSALWEIDLNVPGKQTW